MSTPMVRLATALGLVPGANTKVQPAPQQTRSTPSGPDSWAKFVDALNNYGYGHTPSSTALKMSAVYACNDRICKDLASMPFRPIRRSDAGQEIAYDHPQYFFTKSPNGRMTPYTYKYTINSHVNLTGNGYSPITRDNAGRPISYGLWIPRDVKLEIIDDRIYWVNTRLKEVLSDNDMIHLMWYTENGLEGKSVLSFARDTIETGLAASKMSVTMYENYGYLPGYISVKEALDPDQLDTARQSLASNFMTEGEIPVLDNGAEFKPFSMSLRDQEFIKNQEFGVKDMCRFFGVPGSKVGIRDGNVSYNSLEQENTAYVQDTIVPRAVSIEEEFDRKSLMGDDDEDIRWKHELKNRLRGDTAARTQYYDMGFRNGVFSINDIRRLEDMNTIGPDGDERYINSALKPISQINNPPEDDPEAKAAKGIRALVEEAVSHTNGNGNGKAIHTH